jgi:hypothetical protein
MYKRLDKAGLSVTTKVYYDARWYNLPYTAQWGSSFGNLLPLSIWECPWVLCLRPEVVRDPSYSVKDSYGNHNLNPFPLFAKSLCSLCHQIVWNTIGNLSLRVCQTPRPQWSTLNNVFKAFLVLKLLRWELSANEGWLFQFKSIFPQKWRLHYLRAKLPADLLYSARL